MVFTEHSQITEEPKKGWQSEFFDTLAPRLKSLAESNDVSGFYAMVQALVMEQIEGKHRRTDITYGIKPEDAQKAGTVSLSHEFDLMWNGGKKSHVLNVFLNGDRSTQEQCISDIVDELLEKVPKQEVN